MSAIDDKFDRDLSELKTLRVEMNAGFSELRGEMHAGFSELRGEMLAGFSELRSEIAGMRTDLSASQRHLNLILTAFACGLLGLLGAFVAAQF